MVRQLSAAVAAVGVCAVLASAGCGGESRPGAADRSVGAEEAIPGVEMVPGGGYVSPIVVIDGRQYTCEQVAGLDVPCGEGVHLIFMKFRDRIADFATAYRERLGDSESRSAVTTPMPLQDVAYLGLTACYFRNLGSSFDEYTDYVARNASGVALSGDQSRRALTAAWDEVVVSLCPDPSGYLPTPAEGQYSPDFSGRRAP